MSFSLYSLGKKPRYYSQETGWNAGPIWVKEKYPGYSGLKLQSPLIRPISWSLDWLNCPVSLVCTDSAVMAALFILTQLSWLPWLYPAAPAALIVLTQLSWLSCLYWLTCPSFVGLLTQLSWLPYLFLFSSPCPFVCTDSAVMAPLFVLTHCHGSLVCTDSAVLAPLVVDSAVPAALLVLTMLS